MEIEDNPMHSSGGGVYRSVAVTWVLAQCDLMITLERWLNRTQSANERTCTGETALYRASLNGNERIVRLLIHHGASVNMLAGNLGSPLSAASSKGHAAVARILLMNGANVCMAHAGHTPMTLASKTSTHHRGAIMQVLLHSGADPNYALFDTIRSGSVEDLRLLLANGANLQEGSTYFLLHGLLPGDKTSEEDEQLRKERMISALCSDIQITKSIIDCVAEQKQPKMLSILLGKRRVQSGCLPDLDDALHAALFAADEESARLLLDEGASVENPAR